MKLLIRLALKNSKHYVLLIFTVIAMVLGTASARIEIFAVSIILDTGADFFKLFSSRESKSLSKTAEPVSIEEVKNKWSQVEDKETGKITLESAKEYLANYRGGSILDKLSLYMKSFLGLPKNLLNLAIFVIIIAIFKAISQFAQRYTFSLVGIRVSRDLKQQYFEHLQRLPMSFYQKYDRGSLSSRAAGDSGQIANAINSFLTNYLETPFVFITALTLCFMTSWRLSLVVFVACPLVIFPIIFLAKRIKRVTKQIQRNNESFASVLLDFLFGIQTIKAFVMEKYSLKKYKERNNRMAELEEKNIKYSFAARPILHMLSAFFLGAIIIYGLYIDNMELPQLFLFCGMLYALYMPVKKFAEDNASIMRGVAAAERMFEVLNIKPDIVDRDDAIEMQTLKKAIEFKNVWFKYDDDWIIKDLNFSVKKGETLTIVGPTGAGKSTIMQLLPRLYDVDKGEVCIDGIPITHYSQNSLRENVAFVPQKPFLFLDTVAGNIAFGRDFADEQIQAAAKSAHADEFIQNLPKKYDTMLLEAGKNLSGGQQQRLAIARALVKNAPILLLDEATSSLDSVSENHIKEAIEELHGHITQIIVAHRFSTIQNADRIVYIEKGKKVAFGTKNELLQNCPEFKKMWDTSWGKT